jgi:hypothetical protein
MEAGVESEHTAAEAGSEALEDRDVEAVDVGVKPVDTGERQIVYDGVAGALRGGASSWRSGILCDGGLTRARK